MSTTKTLSAHLLSLHTEPSYSEAINHPFLAAAGAGQLPAERLALWLSQDRIYAAHAYPRFIGSLITRIPFSHFHAISSKEEDANQKILKLLVYCLENIVREVNFFKETADKWDLDMDEWKERKGTKDYTAEMGRVATEGLFDGFVFLWAMEKTYLDAWSYVQSQIQLNSLPVDSAIASFAANWSSAEFVQFVDTLAAFVDGFGITPDSENWRRAEDIWARVVELEVGFWPEEGEEVTMKKA